MPNPIPGYTNPGVYVTQSTLPNIGAISSTTLNTLFLASVPSGNFPTSSNQDVFKVNSTSPQTFTLSQSGTISSFAVTNNTYGNSYSISGSGTTVASGFNIATPTTSGNVTVFTVSGLPANTWLRASYSYTTCTPSTMYTFSDFNSLQSVFGPAFSYVNGTPTVTSPCTLAGYLAFINGASLVSCMNITQTASGVTNPGVDLITGIYGTLNIPGIDVFVPLGMDTTYLTAGQSSGPLFSQLSSFLQAQAYNGVYQRAFIGLNQAVASGTNQSLINTCTSIIGDTNSNSRMSLVAPQTVNYNVGLSSTTGTVTGVVPVDGFYMAAAVAGLYAGLPNVAVPLTNKYINGFSGISNQLTTADSNTLQSYGTLIIRQNNVGALRIRQGLTTNVSSWLTQEISISSVGDALSKQLSSALHNSGLIGSPLSVATINGLQSVVNTTLGKAVSSGLIQAFSKLSYSQNPSNPTAVNITFSYSPTIPLNYINVNLTVDSSTGTVTF